LSSARFDYEPPEHDFDDNEPEDLVDPDQIAHAEQGHATTNGDDPYSRIPENGERTVVTGDPSAGLVGGKVMEQHRSKKVSNEERTTTPYMTKYERARVLGTRALQIRFVFSGGTFSGSVEVLI
jgi:DNA-directed RNA polymerase I, II, and III subunit RPABC2